MKKKVGKKFSPPKKKNSQKKKRKNLEETYNKLILKAGISLHSKYTNDCNLFQDLFFFFKVYIFFCHMQYQFQDTANTPFLDWDSFQRAKRHHSRLLLETTSCDDLPFFLRQRIPNPKLLLGLSRQVSFPWDLDPLPSVSWSWPWTWFCFVFSI